MPFGCDRQLPGHAFSEPRVVCLSQWRPHFLTRDSILRPLSPTSAGIDCQKVSFPSEFTRIDLPMGNPLARKMSARGILRSASCLVASGCLPTAVFSWILWPDNASACVVREDTPSSRIKRAKRRPIQRVPVVVFCTAGIQDIEDKTQVKHLRHESAKTPLET